MRTLPTLSLQHDEACYEAHVFSKHSVKKHTRQFEYMVHHSSLP